MVKFIVLQALLLKDRPLSLTDLAMFTNTERHNITTLIERLRKDGLITTQRNRVDKRVINVELTEKGAELVKMAHPLLGKDIVNQVMSSINKKDMAEFIKLLETIYADTLKLLAAS
jgi:DNA-binding MarR family transcriptional regulator